MSKVHTRVNQTDKKRNHISLHHEWLVQADGQQFNAQFQTRG